MIELIARARELSREIEPRLEGIPPQVQRALHALDIQREEPGLDPGLEEQEIRQAGQARQYLMRLPAGQPVTESLIKDLHRILTSGLGYYGNVPGEYRGEGEMELWGPVGDHKAMDWRAVPSSMRKLLDTVEASEHGAIVKAIVAHIDLLTIHPFFDGNGRVARCVEAYLLHQERINYGAFYCMANYYYQHRYEYTKQLDQARATDSPVSFLHFALGGLICQLAETNRVLALWPEKYGGKTVLGDNAVQEALAELRESVAEVATGNV